MYPLHHALHPACTPPGAQTSRATRLKRSACDHAHTSRPHARTTPPHHASTGYAHTALHAATPRHGGATGHTQIDARRIATRLPSTAPHTATRDTAVPQAIRRSTHDVSPHAPTARSPRGQAMRTPLSPTAPHSATRATTVPQATRLGARRIATHPDRTLTSRQATRIPLLSTAPHRHDGPQATRLGARRIATRRDRMIAFRHPMRTPGGHTLRLRDGGGSACYARQVCPHTCRA